MNAHWLRHTFFQPNVDWLSHLGRRRHASFLVPDVVCVCVCDNRQTVVSTDSAAHCTASGCPQPSVCSRHSDVHRQSDGRAAFHWDVVTHSLTAPVSFPTPHPPPPSSLNVSFSFFAFFLVQSSKNGVVRERGQEVDQADD